jgi:hypothetical protein
MGPPVAWRTSPKNAAVLALLLAMGATGCGAAASAAPSTVAVPAPPAAKTYAVRFDRPSHVGDRTHLVTNRREDTTTKISRDGAVVSDKREQHSVHYDAVTTVIAVDTQSRPVRVRYDVKELTSDGRRLQASVIEITRRGKEKDAEILVDGSPASDDARKVLASLLKLGNAGVSDDDVFGSKSPQPVGGRWAIDGSRAIASLAEDGLDVRSIKGEVWLDGTTRVDGAECLAVRAALDLDGMDVPGMPEGSVTEESHATADLRTSLTIEGRLGRAEDRMSTAMTFRVRVPAPQGPPMMVSVQRNEARDAHETAL